MNIHEEKIALVKELLEIKDPSILSEIKNILHQNDRNDFWDDLTDEQKSEINQARDQIKNGNTTDFESFMNLHRP
ncbi:hypothetical protein GCM10009117_00280 [Gangjinia marincola]|uniref:Addiction module component n=1 Tax=Gangjinia marincola TaxID=578463 RepID=A0ABP3XNJ0_9FLAO